MADVRTHPVFSGSRSVKRSARNNTKTNQLITSVVMCSLVSVLPNVELLPPVLDRKKESSWLSDLL